MAAAQRAANTLRTLQAGKSPFSPFRPYKPPPIPTGLYDPALDAQKRAAGRGYGNLQDDTSLAGARSAEDFGFGQYQLDQARSRENQDYQTNVARLTKGYQDLGTSQEERANAYGVVPGGGAILQAAAKRAANEQTDRGVLDTTHSRALQEIQDSLGQLGVNFDRGVTDRTTALTRAGVENTNFGLDIAAQKAFQAGQVGYAAPGRGQPGGMPRSERVMPGGQHVRTQVVGGVRYTYDRTGKVISRKRVR
jgi:hypothetical protein